MKNFNGALKLSIFLFLLSAFEQVNAQNVSINDDGLAPAASAGLDVRFVGKGLLIPRINLLSTTDNTTIPSPATSLLIYNTNATLGLGYYYNSSITATPNWLKLATGTGSWSITGNSGTTAASNFIGTIDDNALVVRAFNAEIGRFETSTSTYPGAFKVGNATSGTVRALTELNLRQDGALFGSSMLTLTNQSNQNGVIFQTFPGLSVNYPPLVEIIFKTAAGTGFFGTTGPLAVSSNIRLEGRTSALYADLARVSSNPEWQIGFPENPTLVISSATSNVGSAVPTGGPTILRFGNFGIGVNNAGTPMSTTPTASLHVIRASDGTSGTAPLKLEAGTLLTPTTEAGAIENDGTHLYYTSIAGGTRYQLDQQTDALKANIASPTFTGTPLAPTATAGTNTTQIATTAFVNAANATNANLTGDVTSVGNATTYNGVVPIAKGGTNLTTYAQGDIIYASAANVLAKLPVGATGNQVLGTNNANNAPEYKTITGGIGITVTPTAGTITITSGNVKKLASSVTASNSWANINDLSFAVLAGVTYNFKAMIAFDQKNNKGTGWAVYGSMSTSLLSYRSSWGTGASEVAYQLNGFNSASLSGSSPNQYGIAIIEGIFTASSNGTFYISFIGENGVGNAVTAKAGSSLSYW